MSDGIKANPGQLQGMAGQLRSGAEGLDGVADASPPPPEATTSNEKVGHTLAEIMKATGALVAGMHETADKIDASDGSYGDMDNQNASDIAGVPKFSR
jgi:hypothetical protein